MIYHITTADIWTPQLESDTYAAPSLDLEGFIHLSTAAQVAGVLERYYQGVTDIIKLHIDESKLTAELRYEEATGGELFPHVYGTINKDAIIQVEI
jgi:uncharacterized protein (DUF952 family)